MRKPQKRIEYTLRCRYQVEGAQDTDRQCHANHISNFDHSGPEYPCCYARKALNSFTLQMIRAIIRTRPSFAFSRIFCTGLCTTAPLSLPNGHGLLPTSQSPITPKPHFFNSVSTDGKQLPTYRIIDGVGNVIEGAELPEARQNHCALLSRVLIVVPA